MQWRWSELLACVCLNTVLARALTGGLQQLFGTESDATEFIKERFQQQKPAYFSCRDNCTRDHRGLWSLDVMAHITSSGNSRPLQYEKNVKLVKDGQTAFTSQKPAKWSELRNGLMKGATIVANGMQNFHQPLHRLCSTIERELLSWVYVNTYNTPANMAGFAPHLDDTDTLIVQLEGQKEWHFCGLNPVDLIKIRRQKQRGEISDTTNLDPDISCSETLIMSPGDLLYVPLGNVHKVRSVGSDMSGHLTISINRHDLTWATLLSLLADPDSEEQYFRKHADAISKKAAETPALQSRLPLEDFQWSVDNNDLPVGLKESWQKRVLELAKDIEPASLRTHLMEQAKSEKAWQVAFTDFRSRLGMGTLPLHQACVAAMGKTKQSSRFRRTSPWVLIQPMGGQELVVAVDANREKAPASWSAGLRFALGAFDEGTSRRAPFSFLELKAAAAIGSGEVGKMLRFLLDSCAIERVADDPAADATSKIKTEL